MISKEDVIVSITKDGYIKRTSLRSYQASNEETTTKEGDYLIGLYELNTLDVLLLFTNYGNYFYLPVHELPVCVWKDMGKHLSNIVRLDSGEEVMSVIPINDFSQKIDITISTKNGLIKRTNLEEFKTTRTLKPITCIKLKDKDALINAFITKYNDIFIGTNKSYGLWYDVNEIPIVGLRTSGVKSI
jgi:topoisomerase-4 subunit A